MVTQTQLYVNDPSVKSSQEAALTSYSVVTSAQGRPDVNLRLHGQNRACVVHLPEDLLVLQKVGLDLRDGTHAATKGVLISFRDDGKRLTFAGARIDPLRRLPTLRWDGEERVGTLVAYQRSDYLGRPSLIVKVANESRRAEAFGLQLDDIRELGIAFDSLPPRTWTDAPTGYLVRYIAPKQGPNLHFVALEREAAPVVVSPSTDAAPVALLPAWALSVSEKMIAQHEQIVAQEAAASAMQIGENTYALTSNDWLSVPRKERHEIMNHLDPLIQDLLRYCKGEVPIGAVAADWDTLRRTLYSVRSQIAPEMPATNPIQKLKTLHATHQAEFAAEAAATLKKLAKQWLRVRISPKDHEFVAQTKRENVKITFRLEGFGDSKYIRILLHAPILKNYQVSTEVRSKAEGKGALAALWDTFDRRVAKMIAAQTSRRPEYRETREPIMPPMPSRLH